MLKKIKDITDQYNGGMLTSKEYQYYLVDALCVDVVSDEDMNKIALAFEKLED